MTDILDFNKATIGELYAARQRIDALIGLRTESRLAQIEREKEALLAMKAGATPRKDLSPPAVVRKPAAPKPELPKQAMLALRIVRYRNPNKPNETWTGIGRRPTWLKKALQKGEGLKAFRVSSNGVAV